MRRAIGTLATVLLVVAWIVLLRPQSLGGPATYVLVSGDSMQPALADGDFVVAREGDYAVGDIVVFKVPDGDVGEGALVIHRLVGGTASGGFVMQGDNRDAADLWEPRPDDLEGRLWFSVPQGGRFLLLLRSPLVLATIAGFGTFLYIFLAGRGRRRDE